MALEGAENGGALDLLIFATSANRKRYVCRRSPNELIAKDS
jgi:hypothetical protein